MRGKDLLVVQPCTANGITPAYAGKSRSIRWKNTSLQDHPRLCGEKQIRPLWRTWRKGSPPPMRGKGVSFAYAEALAGITPAYAGKSFP